jgi:tetratricopeptide (TPR) repeat protein
MSAMTAREAADASEGGGVSGGAPGPTGSCAGRLDEQSLRSAIADAKTALAAGRLEEAARVEALLADHPDVVALLDVAARIAAARQDLPAAILLHERAASLAPDRLVAYVELARLHRNLGQLEASDAALAAILARDPTNRGALRGLETNATRRRGRRAKRGSDVVADTEVAPASAEVESATVRGLALEREAVREREAGNVDRAASLLQEAAVLTPDRMPVWRDLARNLRSLGRLDESDAALRQILAADPRRLSALTGLAENASLRGDAAGAARLLGEASTAFPLDAAIRRLFVAALRHTDDAEAYAAAARARAEDFPDDTGALTDAADAEVAAGRADAAAAWLDRALALAPAGPEAVALAKALSRAGRSRDALGLLGRAASDGTDPEVLRALARLAAELGEPATARAAYDRALSLDPARVGAWTALATLLAQTTSSAAARAVLQRARGAAGDHVSLDVAEFDLHRQIGLDGPAERVLEAAERQAPGTPALRSRRLAFDLDHGRFDSVAVAVEAMETATVRQQVAAAMAAGRLAEARWRLAEALAAFERALALAPEDGPAHTAVARVLVGLLRPLEARRHLAAAKQASREQQLARGRSLNPSQSLVGQLMSECWSNQAAMTLGRAAIEADTLEAFLALASEEPDYTPGAIAFLVFLRRTGLLAIRPPSAEASAIPRRILQFWDTEELSDDIAELTGSWGAENPGWEYVRHTDRTARAWLESLPDPRPRRAYRSARKPAQKADLLRLALLFYEGGVYADADDRCSAPLEPHVAGRAVVVAQEGRGSVGNNFIAAAPGHPLIGEALELAVTAMLRGDADTIWLSTGPGLLTRAVAAHLAASAKARAELGGSLVVLERFELRRFCSPACKVAYKTTARHWSKQEFGQAV